MSDALAQLSGEGVSVWLDDISRDRLRTGNLQDLIDGKHVVGVTSNPTIFQKALDKGDAYDAQARELALRKIQGDDAIRMLMGFDIRWACDVLRPIYDATRRQGRPGVHRGRPAPGARDRPHHRRGQRAVGGSSTGPMC